LSVSPPRQGRRAVALNAVRALALALLLAAGLGAAHLDIPSGLRWGSVPVSALAAQNDQPVGGSEGAPEHGSAPHEGEPFWKTGARIFNFAILAGVLIYFLRSPFRAFVEARSTQVRSELVSAARMRQEAADRIAGIERRMEALPSELEALNEKGKSDIAAERARIREVAEAERRRLLHQTRREIDMRLRIAERDLTTHAVDRLVTIAAERIRETINEQDQARLIERYLSQVSLVAGGSGREAHPGGEGGARP
jgi:F-type H+-transporting ATPase subunit b